MRDRLHDELTDDPRGRAIWNELEALRGSETVRESRQFVAELKARREQRAWWLIGWRPALPASAFGVAIVALLLVIRPQATETMETAVGEIRQETLADGTRVLLNTDSRLRVTFNDEAREVTLVGGQARFDVAHNPSRPFRVTAGTMTVTAVGTAFDVVTLPKRTSVTLIEGRVLVRTAAKSGAPISPAQMLKPGQQIMIASGRVTPPRPARLDAELAWQRSYVDLGSMTLSEALEEVNRYSETKIVVQASGLDDEEIGGVFKTGDVDAVTEALCTYFDLKVVQREPKRVVLGRAGEGA